MGNLEQGEQFDSWLERVEVSGNSKKVEMSKTTAKAGEPKEIQGKKVVAEFTPDGSVEFKGAKKTPFGHGRLYTQDGNINHENENIQHALNEGWIVEEGGKVFLTEVGRLEFFKDREKDASRAKMLAILAKRAKRGEGEGARDRNGILKLDANVRRKDPKAKIAALLAKYGYEGDFRVTKTDERDIYELRIAGNVIRGTVEHLLQMIASHRGYV